MTPQDIIELVHRRDRLVAERERLVGNIDREIETIDHELGRLTASGNGNGSTSGSVASSSGTVGGSMTYTDKVLAIIERSSVLDYGEVSKEVYGDDTEANRKRLRSLLSSLVQSDRIENAGRNEWRIIERPD